MRYWQSTKQFYLLIACWNDGGCNPVKKYLKQKKILLFFSYKDEVCAGYFVVDPILKINPSSDKTMPLEAVCMQTVTTKQLGPVEEWLDRLRTTYETKYNVVHFTPVQHLGASNSAYSIKDQLKASETQVDWGCSDSFLCIIYPQN